MRTVSKAYLAGLLAAGAAQRDYLANAIGTQACIATTLQAATVV